jgi:UDP-N-acetylglucosamine 4,6-dehydratase
MLKNSSFLITGGTGSFGYTFMSHLLKSDVRSITCFSRDEDKQHALKMTLSDDRVKFILGDIRDVDAVNSALRDIDFVFHAAALKHVPPSENFPMEFVKTNILGSSNLISAISKSNVKKAVFLSTDKAVAPINAMGMTKALMEKLVRSSESSNPSCLTRYGNVIGSRGSVIPQFIKAIREGKEIALTNPKMTRFLMTLDDSVNLVLHALANGNSGDLFVQKSPATTIENLIAALCEMLKIKHPKIQLIGNRPGEKIHETLLTSEERFFSQESDLYFHVTRNYGNFSSEQGQWKDTSLAYSSDNVKMLTVDELIILLENTHEIQNLIK